MLSSFLNDWPQLKPWLQAVLLPPGMPLLVMLLGFFVFARSERLLFRSSGKFLFTLGCLAMYLACCHGAAQWIERVTLLPSVERSGFESDKQPIVALDPRQLSSLFKQRQIHAIVVLGGGAYPASREYGQPALSEASALRLHYGAWLGRQTNVPLAFSGGIGWYAGNQGASEAESAGRWLTQLGLPVLKWSESQSRDTEQSAREIAKIFKAEGIERIALVTHAMHMRRSLRHFEAAGLKVLPAPMNFTEPESQLGLDWLPSGGGARRVRMVAHEWLGLRAMKSTP